MDIELKNCIWLRSGHQIQNGIFGLVPILDLGQFGPRPVRTRDLGTRGLETWDPGTPGPGTQGPRPGDPVTPVLHPFALPG